MEIKYDGEKLTTYSEKDGLQDDEIWGLTIDKNGLIWVGSIGGVSHFDGKKFTPFLLPDTKVENPKPMLSDKLVFNFWKTEMERCGLLPMEMEFSNTKMANSFI